MSYQSPISDMITRLKNGQAARKLEILVNNSKLTNEVLKQLTQEGFIRGYEVLDRKTKVFLKYSLGRPAITLIRLGSRLPISLKSLKKIPSYQGLGRLILTTPKGVLSDYEAIKLSTGGILLLEVL
jgi:small subunit ribosomal protein S8|tara:strand:- start:131 stop:508 length:378 start_codon:yes stop_codon:yes gene_type:complete